MVNTQILIIALISVLVIGLVIYLIIRPKKIVERYDSGEKRRKYYLKNGIRVGTETVYYRNRQVNKIKPYREGVLHGNVKTFFESGALYIDANYIQGELKGPFKIFDDNGKLIQIRDY